MVCDFDLNHF